MVVTVLPATLEIGVDAGAHRLAVDVDRAGAAQRHAAAELGAGQAQRVAQDPEQRHRGNGVHGLRLAVQSELNRSHSILSRWCRS